MKLERMRMLKSSRPRTGQQVSNGLVVFLVALVIQGCSTDIDLNAPYQRTPIVFALLDAEQDTQWVRINRTWLGDGNQYDAALIADSSEFNPEDLEVTVSEWIGDNEVRSWTLKDTTIENKSTDGIFYAPQQQMWFFVPEQGMNSDAEYHFHMLIEGEEEVAAETNMIAQQIGNITQPPPGVANFKLGFASLGFATTFPDLTFKWSSTAGASRYDAMLLIHVTERVWNDLEHTDLLEERDVVVEWPVGTLSTSSDEGGQVLQKEVSGQNFYTNLSSQLEASPYITRVLGTWDNQIQIARAIDFMLTIANEELATYLEINNPITGIILERPEYTNIEGGLGLFASRAQQGVYGIGYTTASIQYLIEGDNTAALNFCSPNPFSEFYCD